jgi:hypothetical protein
MIAKAAPLCRFCGGAIRKRTRTVYLRDRDLQPHETSGAYGRYLRVDTLPSTIDECRKLTNQEVVSSRRHHDPARKAIAFFSEWDGESYVDDYFCNGEHARRFGYVAAAAGHVMAAWQVAVQRQRAAVDGGSN